MSSSHFTDFQDWRKRRLYPDAPELEPAQACSFLIEACAFDDDRSVVRIMEECPQWSSDDATPNNESHPIVACMAMGQRRCLDAFLRHTDCALWPLSGNRTLAHFAVELNAAWALEPLIEAGCDLTQQDACSMTALSLARALDNKEAVGLFKQACKDQRHDYKRLSAIYPHALTTALDAYFSALKTQSRMERSRFDHAHPDFFKQRCVWLHQAGLKPDEPSFILKMASEGQFYTSSYSGFHTAFERALTFALSLGCDINAKGTKEKNDFTPLETAALGLNEGVFKTLLASGAARPGPERPLAQTVWRNLLENSSRTISTHPRPGPRLDFFIKLCSEDQCWPPFAPDAAAIKSLCASEPDLDQQRVLLESFELWIVSGASKKALSAPSSIRI